MQLNTYLTMLSNLSNTIRHHTWAYHTAGERFAFWCDMPTIDDELSKHAKAMQRHFGRIEQDLIPAADDIIAASEGAFGHDERWKRYVDELQAVIEKWKRVAGA